MGDNIINVDTIKLLIDLNRINQNLEIYNKALSSVDAKRDHLFEIWKGQAADSFISQYDVSLQDLHEVYTFLSETNNSLYDICRDFYYCEQEVMRKVRTMGI